MMSAGESVALNPSEIEELNRRFETASAEDILRWATTTFPNDIILTCSFQHDGVAIAHMLRTIKPELPIVFINTGFHFKETLEYRDAIVKLLGLNLVEVGRKITWDEFKARYGQDLYARDPDLCCRINKVEPLLEALKGVRAWINGRRRDQMAERSHIRHVEVQGGIVKINPLANWTSKDTFRYLNAHNIPLHPLFEQGYTSIGCEPCTRPPLSADDERSGRWAGSDKRECGIHTVLDSPGDAAGEPVDPTRNGGRER
jgi:phosphoadenosine phosphosulfate reductase